MSEHNTKPAIVKTASPILKWAGGKRWMIPVAAEGITNYLDYTGGVYYEPFLGGGAMALFLERPKAMLNDALAELIELYQACRTSPGKLAWQLSAFAIEGVEKDNYLRIRAMHDLDTPLKRAARMLYLNRLGYNGLYRVNRGGKFNVPYGDQVYRLSVIERRSRDAITSLFPHKGKLEAVSRAFRGAELWSGDFEDNIKLAGQGDLVYGDPPYDETFSSYTAQRFSEADQERLAEALYRAHQRGAEIILHNSNTEKVRYWYHEWTTMIPTKERRPINRDGENRDGAPCVIATTCPDLLKI
jgi:DNA adenine methylase